MGRNRQLKGTVEIENIFSDQSRICTSFYDGVLKSNPENTNFFSIAERPLLVTRFDVLKPHRLVKIMIDLKLELIS